MAFDPLAYKAAAKEEWQRAAHGWYRWIPEINAWLNLATEAMLDQAGVKDGSRVIDIAAGDGGQSVAAAGRVGSSGEVLVCSAPRLNEPRSTRSGSVWRRTSMGRFWMKVRFLLNLAAVAGLLVLAACASSPPLSTEEKAALVSQHGVLSHEELKAHLIGHSIKGMSPGIGKTWIEFNDPDGTLRGKWADESNTWGGRWTITGPFYCWEYEDSSNGCYLIRLDGDKTIALNKNGSIATDYHPVTILQGNPEGL